MMTQAKSELLALTAWARPKRKRSPPSQLRWISNFFFQRLSLIALMLTFAAPSPGEVLPFKKYTTSDGLAQDSVGRIVRDSRGFLWFCTGEGLSRFDGYQFKNYTRDNGLTHRTVSDLLEARDGRYWVATSAGLVLFNPLGISRPWTGNETEKAAKDESLMFRVFRAEDAEAGKWTPNINRIIEDRQGNIWCAVNGGIYVLDKGNQDGKLRRVDKEAWRGKYNEFTALVEDNSGALWLNSVSGVYRLLPNGSVQVIYDRFGFASLSRDRKGNI
jgi:ligand-binding sensor domain-containing protein